MESRVSYSNNNQRYIITDAATSKGMKQKSSISGTFTFFKQEVQKSVGALNLHDNLRNNLNVFMLF